MAAGASIPNTMNTVGKPNGAMVFYHDSRWWGVFQRVSDQDWTIWELNTVWTDTGVIVHTRNSDRPDVVIGDNRLWSLGRHASSPRLTSCTYSNSVWTVVVDNVTVPNIIGDDDSCIAVARDWATVTVFAFSGASASEIRVNWSTDHGATWQTSATVIHTRNATNANVAALDFDTNKVGVVWSENGSFNDVGFAYVQDGALTDWTVETIPINTLTSTPDSDDHVSIIKDSNNRLYVGMKTGGGSPAKNHAIFVRDATWTLGVEFDSVSLNDRPLMSYNATTNEIIFIGGTVSGQTTINYYTAPAGSTLTLSASQVVLETDTGTFSNLSAPHDKFTSNTGLLVITGETELWFNQILQSVTQFSRRSRLSAKLSLGL